MGCDTSNILPIVTLTPQTSSTNRPRPLPGLQRYLVGNGSLMCRYKYCVLDMVMAHHDQSFVPFNGFRGLTGIIMHGAQMEISCIHVTQMPPMGCGRLHFLQFTLKSSVHFYANVEQLSPTCYPKLFFFSAPICSNLLTLRVQSKRTRISCLSFWFGPKLKFRRCSPLLLIWQCDTSYRTMCKLSSVEGKNPVLRVWRCGDIDPKGTCLTMHLEQRQQTRIINRICQWGIRPFFRVCVLDLECQKCVFNRAKSLVICLQSLFCEGVYDIFNTSGWCLCGYVVLALLNVRGMKYFEVYPNNTSMHPALIAFIHHVSHLYTVSRPINIGTLVLVEQWCALTCFDCKELELTFLSTFYTLLGDSAQFIPLPQMSTERRMGPFTEQGEIDLTLSDDEDTTTYFPRVPIGLFNWLFPRRKIPTMQPQKPVVPNKTLSRPTSLRY